MMKTANMLQYPTVFLSKPENIPNSYYISHPQNLEPCASYGYGSTAKSQRAGLSLPNSTIEEYER